MKKHQTIGAVAATAILFAAGQASAETSYISCIDSVSADQATMVAALGPNFQVIIGFQNSGLPAILQITGICAGDYHFAGTATNPVSFVNHNGTSTTDGTDGFDGMVEFSGTRLTITGLIFKGTALDPTVTSNSTNPSTSRESAALLLNDEAVVSLQGSQVGPATVTGLKVVRGSSATLLGTTISGNGTGPYSASLSSGAFVSENSTLRFGNADGTNGSTVQGNGGYVSGVSCHGYDVLMSLGASAIFYNATVGGTTSGTGANCGELNLTASSFRGRDVTIGHFGGLGPVIKATGASSIQLDQNQSASGGGSGSTVTEVSDGSGAVAAIRMGGASALLLEKTAVASPSANQPTIEASANSTITLAGGNQISNPTSGGLAIKIDHGSSLLHLNGTEFDYNSQTEAIVGDGLIQEQSTVEIGQGTISSSAGFTWTTGINGIGVQQSSSFRLSGGVSIPGTVTISQGSNLFLNTANGGTNSITPGAGVSGVGCTGSSSHVTAPSKAVPPVPTVSSGTGCYLF